MRFVRQVFELTRMRLLLFLREPEALFWVFVFPLLLAVVLAFAFREGDIAPNRAYVVDGPGAAELLATLEEAPHLEVELVADWEEGRTALFAGKVDAVLEANAGAEPTVHLDPQRPEAETARLRILLALEGDSDERVVEVVPFDEAGSRYIDFLFPGLIGLNLMGTGMWTIGFSIAEMRQKKLLRRMMVTPMSRPAYLASFLTARSLFLLFEIVVLTAFGYWALDVPFRGSLVGYLVLVAVGGTIFAGMGMLATARAKTIQGASGLLNVAMMPMWLVSGVFFSYERFPEWLLPVIRWMPLTALNDALREMMLEGAGMVDVASEFVVMGVWGALSFVIALLIFRWE